MEEDVSTTRGGDRRQAMTYFRYASLVAEELSASLGAPEPAVGTSADATQVVGGTEGQAGEAAGDGGLATALWRAAHALAPAAPNERPAPAPGPYQVAAAREEAPPVTGGAGHLDRRG